MRMWEPTFRQQYVVSFKTNSMQKKISEWASCFMWFSFLDNCECFYLGLIRIIITDYKWKWTSASSVVFISLQFISQHDQASQGFICKKEEKVLILPEMKKRNWNHKLSARWCSGITRSVSQATRAWTFLILSMETGDNQEQYERGGHISQWWQYSGLTTDLHTGADILPCSATVSSFVLSSVNGQALSTLHLIRALLSLPCLAASSISRIWTVLCDILLKFSDDGSLCGRWRYDNFIVMSPAL